MRINVHAGHNPAGKVACGAAGILNESTENRRVKEEVLSQLRELGHTVYDCTVNNGTGQADVLNKIVAKCNAHKVDLDVSIHFNSGADRAENGRTTGAEVYVYSESSKAIASAVRICDAIEALGFQNRGVKYNASLYVLRKTASPALLVECCFVDDRDDAELYDYRKMASAIVKGITGQTVQEQPETDKAEPGDETPTGDGAALYRVQVGAFSKRANAEALREQLMQAGFDAFISS